MTSSLFTSRFVFAGPAFAVALTALMPAAALAGAPAKTVPAKTKAEATLEKMQRQPLTFFVAKGPPNACGPGCSEWIAVEGNFDKDAHPRFQEFLGSLDHRNRPIYFNSPGGIISTAYAIGRILRERGMTAGVARSVPDVCGSSSVTSEKCRELIRSNREQKARMHVAGSQCSSACVYALIGASVRQLPDAVRIGVHASTPFTEETPQRRDRRLRFARRYVLEMGVDPGLVDAALKVGPGRTRQLARDEITRFGIETRGRYETPWIGDKDQSGRPIVLKAVTEPINADRTDYQTSLIRAWCGYKAWIMLTYRRAARPSEDGFLYVVRGGIGDGSVLLWEGIAVKTISGSHVFTSLDFLQKAAAAGHMTFTESFSPRAASGWSRVIKLSTEGLAPLLSDWPRQCMES